MKRNAETRTETPPWWQGLKALTQEAWVLLTAAGEVRDVSLAAWSELAEGDYRLLASPGLPPRLHGPHGDWPLDAAEVHRLPPEAEGWVLLRARLSTASAAVVAAPSLPFDGPEQGFTDAMEFHGLWTRDPQLKAQFGIIRQVAATSATVLVRGESGTGKELVARAIHAESDRAKGPFVAINCAALTPSLLESELFGHIRGAFTGATRDHAGVFQRAHQGTLFLDEVAELPMELQAKLLRVLQEQNFTPVGGGRSISVDVRIVGATHRSLRALVEQGRFREDLLYRLRVVPIYLPPLRERRLDVPLLLWHLLARKSGASRRIHAVAPGVMRRLLDYAWPGNVRELSNVVEYAYAVGTQTVLDELDLPPEFRAQLLAKPMFEPTPIRRRRDSIPSPEACMRALKDADGDISRAASLLGVSRTTFWRLRKRWRALEFNPSENAMRQT